MSSWAARWPELAAFGLADQLLVLGHDLLGQPQTGLAVEMGRLQGPVRPEDNYGGGSDDIGDVSWNVPTVTLNYPSNIPGMPGRRQHMPRTTRSICTPAQDAS